MDQKPYSKDLEKYFLKLKKDCLEAHKVASEARKKGFDPDVVVESTLAETMAERVIGLISVVAPQIKGKGAEKRIYNLEKEYGILDVRVALKIAEEVAREKFCKFKDEKEAIEMGIRAGFTYVTLGVVSSPLEGFTHLELKNRNDGKGKYLCLYYSGPIRNAGGTAAAWSVVIGDYIRKKFGYQEYDPTEREIKRCATELEDYHEYITNLQYFPSKEESEFLMQHLPVEISGDPSEKYEISNINYKDLPRVNTNLLRSGYCLIHSSCIPLKAPKLWAKISEWAKDFDMEHWNFLENFLKIQKKSKAKGEKVEKGKIAPDYTFIKDLVAGRPVFSHPMAKGGFRLRYGRSRVSGYSGQSIHPATMQILNGYLATGTQLKVERPGKAAAFTVCNELDGPIVKLKNGNVLMLETEELAIKNRKEIKTILFLGDILISYGDFFDRAHPLVPPGYCPEFWMLEFEKKAIDLFGTFDYEKISEVINISEENMKTLFSKPISTKLSLNAAIEISAAFKIPLHPRYTFYWTCLDLEQIKKLFCWLKTFEFREDNLVLKNSDEKEILELAGIPHLLISNEFVVLEKDVARAFMIQTNISDIESINQSLKILETGEFTNSLDFINKISQFKVRDKSGTFIGARMGRPEKAKMREMTGGPNGLFPVGDEGGKFRSFQSALEAGKVSGDFAVFYCSSCKNEAIFSICEVCGKKTEKVMCCNLCGLTKGCNHSPKPYKYKEIDIKKIFEGALKKIGANIFPDLIKGVKGTFNPEHIPEHLVKSILRAKHGLKVNKDGTIRYDCSELPITHFKPKEINASIEKLQELGYKKDIFGKTLESENQILEIRPQDIIIPCSPVSPNEKSDEILFRTTKFIDDLLTGLYDLKQFYKLESKEDLIGHYVVGLAPHTSAGILGRIIGFSRTQGFFAHPLFHAAMRRDVDGDESCFFLLMDCFLNFSNKFLPSSRGSTMDAPLVLTYFLNPTEVDDMVFNVDIAFKYPLEFYLAALEHKMPWEVKIRQVGQFLRTPLQYEGYGFTHSTLDFNRGVLCSAYKLLPSMEEKLKGQMDLAEKIRAVDETDVARLVIEKHFLRDIKGNLKKFSSQKFRCVNCNEKYRRPPLIGKCLKCNGKIIFTISEGSVVKYLEPSISLAKKYNVSPYLMQTLELTKKRVEDLFGKDQERQEGLGKWFD
ncbi:MAG: DNA polymerase II large subunit [Nanoarchaeota archaeon]|nr:DNA polymerase II large subunit [Nanoarchaeota archaeon]MBU1270520.1 DNA polymerase II large subunit [Nanoarchaeota archaeon]MBU1605137.1 DNA polymerase II large subunit [Nanoarchaeota archaeon]MBU2442694.1 DNA polymerase II large subunit [Nanoarchaeota archaeon]